MLGVEPANVLITGWILILLRRRRDDIAQQLITDQPPAAPIARRRHFGLWGADRDALAGRGCRLLHRLLRLRYRAMREASGKTADVEPPANQEGRAEDADTEQKRSEVHSPQPIAGRRITAPTGSSVKPPIPS